jgi:hypothetical protein
MGICILVLKQQKKTRILCVQLPEHLTLLDNFSIKNRLLLLDVVAHAYNPSYLGGKD